MQAEEMVVVLLAVAGGFILIVTWMSQRYYARQSRLKLIEKAMASGNLDPDMRRNMLEALSPRRSEWLQALGGQMTWFARNLVFVGGWITMFAGVGVWIAAEVWHWHAADAQSGMVAAFVGFALVSLPMALAELDRRRGAESHR